MRLTKDQVANLYQRMQDEGVKEVEVKENGSGTIRFYVPEVKLVQFPLVKRKQRERV